MKKRVFAFALILTYGFLFISCSKDEDSNSNNQDAAQTIIEIEQTVETGSWVVSKYIDSGDDETNDYNGYSFSFNADGTLVATSGSNTVSGSWSVTNSSSSSSDDDSSDDNDVDFNIFFASPAAFSELSDDWDILSRTSTQVELRDVSGGDGSVDLLTFVKN